MKSSVSRAAQIASVVASIGCGYLVHDFHMPWHKRLTQRFRSSTDALLPQKVREACEQLGGGFIKLGQLLSLRPDLVPDAYCTELRRLQDNVTPLPFADVKQILVREGVVDKLGTIEEKPLGSASIAQVHKATLQDGTKVVLKVQRPGVREHIMADIALMERLALRCDKHFQSNRYSFRAIVQELKRYTEDELNFEIERERMKTFFDHFTKDTHIRIPRVYPQLSTSKVLVTSHLTGAKLSRVDVTKAYVHAPFLAQRLVDAYFAMVFDLGLFHADLHPGNIIVMRQGRAGIIDYGIVGTLTQEYQKAGLQLFLGLCEFDASLVARALFKIAPASPLTDIVQFKRDVTLAMVSFRHHPKRITSLLHRILDLAVQHKLAVPSDVVLLGKAAVTLEGTCQYLDPEFSLESTVKPLVESRILKRRGFRTKDMVARITKLRASFDDWDETLREIADRVKTGSLKIDIEDSDIATLGSNIEHSSNRLSYALVTCAFIVAGALVAHTGPLVGVISLFSYVLFALALLTFGALITSILRERKVTV